MVAKDFEVDDLVWARMKGYPPWPAKIAEPQDPKSPSAKKAQHFVYFFGTKNYAWILDENIMPHSDEMLKNSESYKKKTASLQKAIEEIQEESKTSPPKKIVVQQPLLETPKKSAQQKPKKTPKRSKPMPASKKAAKKRKTSEEAAFDTLQEEDQAPPSIADVEQDQPDSNDNSDAERETFLNSRNSEEEGPSDEENREPDYTGKKAIPKKSPAKRKVHVVPDYSSSSDEELDLDFFPVKTERASNIAVIQPFKDDNYRPIQLTGARTRSDLPRPALPYLDVLTSTDRLIMKKVEPTNKKIGFLGLGLIGRGMVKNLLNSGHMVTIWNRTRERCLDFARAGAIIAEAPSDVVAACDITMCCVSDSAAVKELVLGPSGILKGMARGKGYVEMTSIDPATSKMIAGAITDKKGRYLEAPVIGDPSMSVQGDLVLVAAGDQQVFDDCESCFRAISRSSYYVSCDVGRAAQMRLIYSMLTGSVVASLAEAMALMDSSRLSSTDFLDVLGLSPLASDYLLLKCQLMMNSNYVPHTLLKHQQEDLVMALDIGNTHSQPLCMAAAANDMFKRARMLGYSDQDVAAVQIGAKVN